MPGGEQHDMPDLLPRPDPTVLTTAQLYREIANTERQLAGQIDNLRAAMNGHWRLDEERFGAVERSIISGEATRIEQKADTAKALDAALSVVRQENARIEANTLRQIDAERNTSRAEWSGLSAQVNDHKDQLAALRNVKLGGSESRASTFATVAAIVSVLSLTITIVLAAVALAR